MPFGDGTGPGGVGPQTGRGLGFCSGYAHPGNVMGRGSGRGRNFRTAGGFGRGMGFRPGYGRYTDYGSLESPNLSPEQEKDQLENQIMSMEKSIDRLKKRVKELDGKK